MIFYTSVLFSVLFARDALLLSAFALVLSVILRNLLSSNSSSPSWMATTVTSIVQSLPAKLILYNYSVMVCTKANVNDCKLLWDGFSGDRIYEKRRAQRKHHRRTNKQFAKSQGLVVVRQGARPAYFRRVLFDLHNHVYCVYSLMRSKKMHSRLLINILM